MEILEVLVVILVVVLIFYFGKKVMREGMKPARDIYQADSLGIARKDDLRLYY